MDMSGSYRITAPREDVWAALNDPEILKRCIPGCEEIEKQSDTEMTAKVTAKVGPVKAKFAGKVTLSDIDPPNGYTITGEGTGGAAGFGKGGAAVKLMPDGADATVLEYTAHAQVGGKLAQIGSRLIDGTARKMADDFFAKFSEVVGSPADEVVGAPIEEVAVEPDDAPVAVPSGQFAAQPMSVAAFAAPDHAINHTVREAPVDLRLVGGVGLAVVAFVVILYAIAGS
ncbi:carbon monoxide dehydrogenase subunit G [Skermanella stibiiresistens SB22]|uniref:Carbon monoxide dehydrogenase subunit G n=1 Tax=Skermanella stibiiresistens SB22 TaxID=1385369 RepID=W9H028_9PROT|nr:carbon monoxide dehydrogenase subunit G [Skermanella stibiiresistens]EWY38067.1 carbon monoxide dehydrogenase subunit G [Skermanella stibiiresistens SB22]